MLNRLHLLGGYALKGDPLSSDPPFVLEPRISNSCVGNSKLVTNSTNRFRCCQIFFLNKSKTMLPFTLRQIGWQLLDYKIFQLLKGATTSWEIMGKQWPILEWHRKLRGKIHDGITHWQRQSASGTA